MLFDAGREHWTDEDVVALLGDYRRDVVMLDRSASKKSHPGIVQLMGAVKSPLPHVLTVYGGVHPAFLFEEILAQHAY